MQKAVIWDWNGTLLEDVRLTFELTNKMLEKRGKPKLGLEEYRNKFSFPIIDYYMKLGFEFLNESGFLEIVNEFNSKYKNHMSRCLLQYNAIYALQKFQAKGYQQYILSGLNHKDLVQAVTEKGIKQFFLLVVGSNTTDASDKIEKLSLLIHEERLIKDDTIIIGDTVSDYYLAEKVGCKSILIAQGHQSKECLGVCNTAKIVDDFSSLIKIDGIGKMYE